MPSDNEEVLVVSAQNLFRNNGFFLGFKEKDEFYLYEKIIEEKSFILVHERASKNFILKQPIAYVALFNPYQEKFFMYERACEDKKYGENIV